VDSVRAHLKQREALDEVIDGGVDYLVREWSRIATAVEGRREKWMWEEWVNDLDTREMLRDLLEHVPESRATTPAIEAADARFLSAGRETDECEWGTANAARHGWTPEKNWWYWRQPPTPYLP
jgi:hypothetical protein